MIEKELCEMCNDYSIEISCDYKDKCKLLKIIKENEELKKEIKELKLKISYMINPNEIDDRQEMGG